MVKTLAGSAESGTVFPKILIGDTEIWRGQAMAVPRQAKETGDGLLPIYFFRSIYVCNSESYIVFN
jgi:hypothetical protein